MAGEGRGTQIAWSNGGTLAAFAVAPHTFRIRAKVRGHFGESALHRYGILREKDECFTVDVEERADAILFETSEACLRIGRADGQVALCRRGPGQERLRLTLSSLIVGEEGGFTICLALTEGERLYGLGNAVPDRLQLRGCRAYLSAEPGASPAPVPYVMSSGGWAVLVNTTWPSSFDLGQTIPDQMSITAEEGELDFYLFCGESFRELLERYTAIAGRPRLLPIWAYGLTYIRDIWTHDREVLDDVLKFRQEGIPCDLIGLGSGWNDTNNGTAGSVRWHSTRFSAPVNGQDRSFTFMDMLRRHGFKLGLLMHCTGYDLTAYAEWLASEVDSRRGEAAPDSWYDRLRPFAEEGVASFRFSSYSQLELGTGRDRVWANGMSDRELCNLYPLLLGKQVYDGYVEQTGKRPFVHCVSGYIGMQQFAALESGRYNSGALAVVQALSLGLSGYAHAASHINVDMRESIHAGFLQPWSFMNSGSYFRNPCVLEKSLREMFRRYAKLRIRLLPYVYATAHAAVRSGMPIARAMPLMFPNDPHCDEWKQQYMLGEFLLVAVFTNRVYLPEGRWIHYWTGEVLEGRQILSCSLPDEAGGPLFIREGAILPMGPEVDFIGQMELACVSLHLYPGGHSQFTLVEDDGITPAYEQGSMATTAISCDASDGQITVWIGPRTGSYEGMPDNRKYELSLFVGRKPARVLLNGEPLSENRARSKGRPQTGWRYIGNTGCVQLDVTEGSGTEARLRLIMDETEERAGKEPLAAEQRNGEKEAAGAGAAAIANGAGRSVTDEELVLALETNDEAAVEAMLDNWWKQAGVDWRLHLLHGCSLLIGHMKRRGWTASDVWGRDTEHLYMMQRIRTPEQGHALLGRLVRRIIDFARPATASDMHPVIREVVAIVEAELKQKLSLQQVAQRTNVHPFYLSRLFKQQMGQPFSGYILKHRMNKARALLESGMKVYEAADECGFRDTSHFSRVFAKYWGAPPEQFKPRRRT